jgi:hypothetical protein
MLLQLKTNWMSPHGLRSSSKKRTANAISLGAASKGNSYGQNAYVQVARKLSESTAVEESKMTSTDAEEIQKAIDQTVARWTAKKAPKKGTAVTSKRPKRKKKEKIEVEDFHEYFNRAPVLIEESDAGKALAALRDRLTGNE